MIVDNSDIESIAVDPAEDDPPLLVDTDAVEPPEVAAQSFKVVARWDAQVVQVRGPVDELQLAKGAAPQVCRDTPGPGAVLAGGQVGTSTAAQPHASVQTAMGMNQGALYWVGCAVMLLTAAAMHVLTR